MTGLPEGWFLSILNFDVIKSNYYFIKCIIISHNMKAATGLLSKDWDRRRVKGVINPPVNLMAGHQPILEEVES